MGLGLGLGEAPTVKLKLQTSSVVVSWTCGSWGEVVGLGLGVGEGVGAGCFNWKNKTTAVVSKMAVKPISPPINHLLLFFIRPYPKWCKQWWCYSYIPGIALPNHQFEK